MASDRMMKCCRQFMRCQSAFRSSKMRIDKGSIGWTFDPIGDQLETAWLCLGCQCRKKSQMLIFNRQNCRSTCNTYTGNMQIHGIILSQSIIHWTMSIQFTFDTNHFSSLYIDGYRVAQYLLGFLVLVVCEFDTTKPIFH